MILRVHNIITVTQGGLLYRDEQDIVRWIDFRKCSHNWVQSRERATSWDMRCVGWRNTVDDELDVEFFSEPKLRFVFLSFVQRDTQLLNPLKRLGWDTWDQNAT